MKEQDLIDLGFERVDDTNEGFYYYINEIGNDHTPFCLISNADDEAKHGWEVRIFDYDTFLFTDVEQLKQFIDILINNANVSDS